MSLYDFIAAKKLYEEDAPFYALIMAAMLRADTDNTEKLRWAWPEIYRELDARYHALDGVLPEDAA